MAIEQVLEKGIRFVSLRVCGLPGYVSTSLATVRLGDNEAPSDVFVDPSVRILPASWRQRFQRVEGEARKCIRVASPSFENAVDLPAVLSLRGVYPIAATSATKVESDVNHVINGSFRDLKTEFISSFPKIIDDLREKIASSAAWSEISTKLPTQSQLETRVTMAFDRIPLTFLAESAGDMAKQVVGGIMGSIASAITNEASKITERIKHEKRRFTAASLNELRRQFDLLRSFQFMASEDTMAKLVAVESSLTNLGHDPHTALNQASAAIDASIGTFSAAMKTLGDSIAIDAGGVRKRKIHLE